MNFVGVWDRFAAGALPGAVAPKLGHSEQSLYPLYTDLESHLSRLRENLRTGDIGQRRVVMSRLVPSWLRPRRLLVMVVIGAAGLVGGMGARRAHDADLGTGSPSHGVGSRPAQSWAAHPSPGFSMVSVVVGRRRPDVDAAR